MQKHWNNALWEYDLLAKEMLENVNKARMERSHHEFD